MPWPGWPTDYKYPWADKTPDPELKACLNLVAKRETSHYHIFKRRIEELGYTLEEKEDPDFHERSDAYSEVSQ